MVLWEEIFFFSGISCFRFLTFDTLHSVTTLGLLAEFTILRKLPQKPSLLIVKILVLPKFPTKRRVPHCRFHQICKQTQLTFPGFIIFRFQVRLCTPTGISHSQNLIFSFTPLLYCYQENQITSTQKNHFIRRKSVFLTKIMHTNRSLGRFLC